jgi:hypothetical protein
MPDRRELYVSSNSDRWFLSRRDDGDVVVIHQPNVASGGKPSTIPLHTFLAPANRGPEHQALRELIGSLVVFEDSVV